MEKQENTKIMTIAIANNAAPAGRAVSVLRVKTPEDVDAAMFLAQLEKAKSRRRNAYDTSPEAAIDAMRRKYGYAIETLPVDIFIDASRSDWYACAAGK